MEVDEIGHRGHRLENQVEWLEDRAVVDLSEGGSEPEDEGHHSGTRGGVDSNPSRGGRVVMRGGTTLQGDLGTKNRRAGAQGNMAVRQEGACRDRTPSPLHERRQQRREVGGRASGNLRARRLDVDRRDLWKRRSQEDETRRQGLRDQFWEDSDCYNNIRNGGDDARDDAGDDVSDSGEFDRDADYRTKAIYDFLNKNKGMALINAQDEAERNLARMTSTPFVRKIRNQQPPAKFSSPIFELYDGKSDPVNHVAMYSHKMVLWVDNEALMCKMFPASLGKTALNWFHSLEIDSINSWSRLAKKFVSRFIANSKEPTSIESLYALRMRRDEGLRKFAIRFMDYYSDIDGCDEKSAIGAFRLALSHGCKLRENLTLMKPSSMSELQERVRQYVNLEDDSKIARDRNSHSPPRKARGSDSEFNRARGQAGHDRGLLPATTSQAVNAVFKIPIRKILDQIKDKPYFRWLMPLRGDPSSRDQSKFCSYHRDKGNPTEECRTLKNHLEKLVSLGHLKEFLSREGGSGSARDEEIPSQPVT